MHALYIGGLYLVPETFWSHEHHQSDPMEEVGVAPEHLDVASNQNRKLRNLWKMN